jgi:hypothetical protein
MFTGSSLIPRFLHAPGPFEGEASFTYTVSANGQTDDATVTAIVHDREVDPELPEIDPGEGIAKNDIIKVAQWRNQLVQFDRNDEVKRADGAEIIAINGQKVRPGDEVQVSGGSVTISDKGTPNFEPSRGWQMEPLYLPSPEAVVERTWQIANEGFRGTSLFGHLGWSLFRVIAGFVCGAIVGIPLGYAMGLSNWFRGWFDPIVEFMRPVPPLALIPLVATLIIFTLVAKNSPNRPKPKAGRDYLIALNDKDSWWFMFFYSVTFGGFIGLASALPGYFSDQYGLNPVVAGYYTAACVMAGSLMRPLGGALADRIGGIRSLLCMYGSSSVCIALVGFNLSSSLAALALFVAAMLGLGAGNGAVFQLVPQRFHREIGVMTGLIGMAGGVGGFVLAAGLGTIKQQTGDYQLGLWMFAALGLLALIGLVGVKRRWRTTWGSSAMTSARV